MWIQNVLIVLILFKFSTALDHDKFSGNATVNADFIKAIQFIFDNVYFSKHKTVNVITATEKPIKIEMKDFRNAVLRHKNKNYIFKSEYYKSKLLCRVNNLIIIDSFRSFTKLDERISKIIANSVSSYTKEINYLSFDVRAKFLLAFPLGSLSCEQNRKILKTLWKKGLYNVNLMYEGEDDEIFMTTFWPFRDGLCDNTNEIIVDIFRNGSFVNDSAEHIFSNGKFCYFFKSRY